MNKKSEKFLSRMEKKVYNTPQLSVHGELSEITKSGPNPPTPEDEWGCSG